MRTSGKSLRSKRAGSSHRRKGPAASRWELQSSHSHCGRHLCPLQMHNFNIWYLFCNIFGGQPAMALQGGFFCAQQADSIKF